MRIVRTAAVGLEQNPGLGRSCPRHSSEECMRTASCGLRTVWLAATLAPLLALTTCAETPPSDPTVIWNSDRVAPSSVQPVGPTGAAPASPAPPGPAQTAPSTGTGSSAAAPPTEECREFTETVTIGGRQQPAHGRACRQSDGTWRVERPLQMPQLPTPSARVATAAPYPAGPGFPATGGSLFFGSEFLRGEHYRFAFNRD